MIAVYFIGIIGLLWIVLSLIAQMERYAPPLEVGNPKEKNHSALMVYNPDLFYDLDKKVCIAMAEGLKTRNWHSDIITVADARNSETLSDNYDLYVFCANTYNWAPDQPVSNFISNFEQIRGKPVVAITLGSGSTNRSQKLLEQLIGNRGGKLLASEVYWLMRPNDETRPDISNVDLAKEKSRSLGERTASWFVNSIP